MTGSLPPAPPVPRLGMISPSTYNTIILGTDPHLKDIGKGILNPEVIAMFDCKMIQAFRDLREVILYREYFHCNECTLPVDEVEYFNNKSYHLRYLALTIPFERQTHTTYKQEPCRIALLIFWNANYLTCQPDSALFRALTTQLKSTLEQSDLELFWGPHHTLLMWVLFLGAHISAGQRERPWFIMNLARGAWLLGSKKVGGNENDPDAVLLHRSSLPEESSGRVGGGGDGNGYDAEARVYFC
jgi:hypothetical protein